jgi:hydroxymethylbilane synthase
MIMAAAGLQRLGLDHYITELIDPEIIMPAVSQGAIAIEARIDDQEIDVLISAINHQETWNAITAERAFLAHLQGGCQVPLGCYSKIKNGQLILSGFVASVDGKQSIRDSVSGEAIEGASLGIRLASILQKKGADEILNKIKSDNQPST